MYRTKLICLFTMIFFLWFLCFFFLFNFFVYLILIEIRCSTWCYLWVHWRLWGLSNYFTVEYIKLWCKKYWVKNPWLITIRHYFDEFRCFNFFFTWIKQQISKLLRIKVIIILLFFFNHIIYKMETIIIVLLYCKHLFHEWIRRFRPTTSFGLVNMLMKDGFLVNGVSLVLAIFNFIFVWKVYLWKVNGIEQKFLKYILQ